jgi:threonine dehydrogenase-like Zn-dependent dehydrogenase
MKALVLNGIGHGFNFENVDIAAPIGREVLVDVQASGLCHTDLLFATHDFVPTPSVLGHEVAGVVAAIGPDVAQIRVGDHVVGSLAQSCGHALEVCLAGPSSANIRRRRYADRLMHRACPETGPACTRALDWEASPNRRSSTRTNSPRCPRSFRSPRQRCSAAAL